MHHRWEVLPQHYDLLVELENPLYLIITVAAGISRKPQSRLWFSLNFIKRSTNFYYPVKDNIISLSCFRGQVTVCSDYSCYCGLHPQLAAHPPPPGMCALPLRGQLNSNEGSSGTLLWGPGDAATVWEGVNNMTTQSRALRHIKLKWLCSYLMITFRPFLYFGSGSVEEVESFKIVVFWQKIMFHMLKASLSKTYQ